MYPPESFVAQARAGLERTGYIPAGFLPADIYESWERCARTGLDSSRAPVERVESASTLRDAREARGPMRRFALAEMEALHGRIAGSNFILALASPDGMILDTIADDFGVSPRALLVRPGSHWSETRCGTNAVGTAMLLGRQVTVHGGEHFFRRFGGLTCIASPIFAPDGSLVGILDASSDVRARFHHTRALVAMAATQVENSLLRDRHGDDVLIAFHLRPEYLRTLNVGLIAVRLDGRILAANGQARALLGDLVAGLSRRFEDVFDMSLEAVIAVARQRDVQAIRTVGSEIVAATVENAWSVDKAKRVGMKHHAPATNFVAEDPTVAQIVRQVEAAAARKIPILIRGETGTGKEQLARHAHVASGRRGAFVAVNCAGLPASLIEAELFGYTDGAFTGARRGGSPGLVREADGGTLFLDEIGDMPIGLQAVLLRFLDDWTARPIGGAGAKVDVLLVSATNAGLDRAIGEGRFRADLLYRLNILEVTLPPLAARADFERIVRRLLATIDPDASIADGTIARLAEQPWPGNIRQLRNMLTRFSLAASAGPIDDAALDAMSDATGEPQGDETLRDTQRARILAAYNQSGGNISETSRRLNISRNTVYRALERQGAKR